MGRVLFLCNTPYQIIIATQLRLTVCKNDISDIIITDHMNQGEHIAANIKNGNIFNKIFYIEIKNKFENFNIICKLFYSFSNKQRNKYLSKFITINNSYEAFYLANTIEINPYIYNRVSLNNKKNGIVNPKIYLFEDGLSTYSSLYEKLIKNVLISNTNSIMKNLQIKLRSQSTYKNLAGCYFFNPRLIQWKPTVSVLEIPKIDPDDNNTKECLNNIFDYKNCHDRYDENIIFFEESYYADGKEVNDIEVVDKLASKYGKENIMVKIHPRNHKNRFKELGYKTNVDTFVPWEVIALNKNIKNKELVTIMSSSVMNPYLLFGIKANYVLLFKCIKVDKYVNENIEFVTQKICEKYKDIYNTPTEFNQM